MVRAAMKAAEKDYARAESDLERNRWVSEAARLLAAGCSTQTVSTLTGIHERQINRIQNGQITTVPMRSVRWDHSEERAHHLAVTADAVLDMAVQIRDQDPALVWSALDKLGHQELIEVAMIALAAVPIDSPKSRIWEWLC